MEDLQIIDNPVSIQAEADETALKKYMKRIVTARVLIFILAGVTLIGAIAALSLGMHPGGTIYFSFGIFSGILALFILGLGLLSLRKQFVPILIVAILYGVAFCYMLPGALDLNFGSLVSLFVNLSFIFFIFRGAVFARKYEQLKKQARRQQ